MSSRKKKDFTEEITDFLEIPETTPAESLAPGDLGKDFTEEITDFLEIPEEKPVEGPASEDRGDEIQTLVGKLDEMKDKYLRSLAEMENMKKRFQRDRENTLRFCNESLLRDLVRVYDSIDKSVQVAKDLHPDDTNFIDGLEMVEKLFIETLKRHHIEPIDAKKGTPFDPNYHEAMLQRVDDDITKPDIVVDEFEKGFMLHDRVLRPAKVSVSIENTPDTNKGGM
jgi:molecular chaperone GrpE